VEGLWWDGRAYPPRSFLKSATGHKATCMRIIDSNREGLSVQHPRRLCSSFLQAPRALLFGVGCGRLFHVLQHTAVLLGHLVYCLTVRLRLECCERAGCSLTPRRASRCGARRRATGSAWPLWPHVSCLSAGRFTSTDAIYSGQTVVSATVGVLPCAGVVTDALPFFFAIWRLLACSLALPGDRRLEARAGSTTAVVRWIFVAKIRRHHTIPGARLSVWLFGAVTTANCCCRLPGLPHNCNCRVSSFLCRTNKVPSPNFVRHMGRVDFSVVARW
jgi:hypothetical protein